MKLSLNQQGKAKREFWWLGPKGEFKKILFFLACFSVVLQLGRHFWPDFSFVNGIRIDFLSPTFYLSDFIIILFIIQELNFKEIISTSKNTWFVVFSLLILFLVIGSLAATSPILAAMGLFKFLEFLLFGIAIAKNIRSSNLKIFLNAVMVGIFFESALTIFQVINRGSINGIFYFFGERFYNSQTPNIANASVNGELILRPYGTFPHPNVLAGFFVISMFLILVNFKSVPNKNLFLLSLVFGSFSLFLTLSRISIVVWITSLVLVLTTNKKIRALLKDKILFLVSLLLIFIFILPTTMQRFFSSSLLDQSVVERLNLTKASFVMIKVNPILGVGINNFLIELPKIYKGQGLVFSLQPVHNVFLLLLSEIGIPAFTVVCFSLIKLFLNASLEYKFLILIVLVLGSFDHYFLTLQQGMILLTFCLSIVAASTKLKT